MKIFKLPLVLLIISGLSGCSSLVTKYIQSAESYDYGNIASEKDIAELGFKKGRYCSSKIEQCISYLAGKAIDSKRLEYETELTSGSSSSEVSLNLSRESVPAGLNGTVVLLHGFRASKEFMLNSALYFRFLGFDVLVPDLLGHGESEGKKAYGVNDAFIIDGLISSEHTSDKHLFLLGNSMGAVTAAYLSNMRADVNGVILQAPMLKFDEAVLRYTRTNYPHLQKIVSDEAILNGAFIALGEAGLEVKDTDISQLILNTNTPLLIFASSHDPVAPYEKFSHMDSDLIEVKEVPGRTHTGMGVIDDESSEIIIGWLEELARQGSG